jgi:hypothetical protein
MVEGGRKEKFIRHLSCFGYFQQMDKGKDEALTAYIHTENFEERELEKGKSTETTLKKEG